MAWTPSWTVRLSDPLRVHACARIAQHAASQSLGACIPSPARLSARIIFPADIWGDDIVLSSTRAENDAADTAAPRHPPPAAMPAAEPVAIHVVPCKACGEARKEASALRAQLQESERGPVPHTATGASTATGTALPLSGDGQG